MKRIVLVVFWAISVLALVAACAPAQAPATATPASPPTAGKTTVPSATPVVSSDTAWDAVVAAAKKEGKVTAYSYGWTGDVGVAVSRAFEAKYGIKVDIITGRGSAFVERLKTEQRSGAMVGDLFEGASAQALNLKMSGLSVQLASSIPALKDTSAFVASPFVNDPDGHVVAYNVWIYSPFVSTDLVKPGEEPKTWKDLLDPKWKGKMLFASPALSMGPYMQFWPLKAEGAIDMEYLKALGKQDIMWTTGMVDDMAHLSRGERSLTIYGSPVDASPFILQGAHIRAISMEPGMAGDTLVVAAIKNSPHPAAARLLANWILTEEGQNVHNQARGLASILKAAPSFLPKSAQINPSHIAIPSPDTVADEAKSFNEKVLVSLWGLK